MPRFTIRDNDTGRTLVVEGETAPTPEDMAELFQEATRQERTALLEKRTRLEPGVNSWDPEAEQLRIGAEELTRAALTKGGGVGDAAARIVPPIAGGIAGAVGGIPGMMAGGAAGGVAGEALAQEREFLRGERDTMSPGQLVAGGVSGAVPFPPLKFVGAPARTAAGAAARIYGQTMAQRGAQGALVNTVAEGTRQAIDEGEADWRGLAIAAGLGFGLGAGVGAGEAALLRRNVLQRIRQTPEFRDFKGTDQELADAVRARMAQEARPAPPVVETPPELPPAGATSQPVPPIAPEVPPAAPISPKVADLLGVTPPATPPTPILPANAAGPAANAATPSGLVDTPAAPPPAGPAAPAAPGLSYEDFRASYLATFQRMQELGEGPEAEALARQMADMADAYPQYAAAAEAETDLPPTPDNLLPQPKPEGGATNGQEVQKEGQVSTPDNPPEAPAAPADPAPAQGGNQPPAPTAAADAGTPGASQAPAGSDEAAQRSGGAGTVVPAKGKGKRRTIGPNPIAPDILDWIQDAGGIPPKPRGATGGEWDEYSRIFGSGPGRLLVDGSKRGQGIDVWLRNNAPETAYAHLTGDWRGFFAEVERALEQRAKLKTQFAQEKTVATFMTAALEGKGRAPREPRAGEPINSNELKVGDKGEIKGQEFEVVRVNEDESVVLKDGPRVPPLTLPPDAPVHFDKGTAQIKPPAEAADVAFFDEKPPAAPPAAAPDIPPSVRQSAPADELIAPDAMPFNLAGEAQPETKSAIELAAEAQARAEAQAAQDKAQRRMFDDEAGTIDPRLLYPLARAVLGGAVGALEGDTPEERLAYAFGGALLGLSAPAAARLAKRVLAKWSPPRVPNPKYAFDPGAPIVAVHPTTGLPAARARIGALEFVKPIQMPELVQLVRQLTQRDVELKRFPRAHGMFYGSPSAFHVALDRRVFRDPVLAQQVIAHEIGHLVDFLPDKTMQRGNLLGRLASVREYLAKTLPDTPWNPNKALSPAERNKLRSQAEAATRASLGARPPVDEEADRAAWNAALSEKYHELIAEEIERRGLIKEQEARAELIELTEWWTPFDRDKVPPSYIEYRESSEELYAEALSVLLNDPAELAARAPIFWKTFTAYFDRKPEAKEALQGLWYFLHQGERAAIAARNERLKAGFATAEEFLLHHARERELNRTTLRGIVDQTKQEWWNIYQPIIERTRAAKAAGAKLRWHEDPEAFFDSHPLAENANYLWLERLNRSVFQPVEAAGFTRDDLGLYLFHNRVLRESYRGRDGRETGRSLLANPEGITPLQARTALLSMRLAYGPARMRALEAQAQKLQEAFFELIRDGHAAGVFTDEHLALARANKEAYAPFAIVDYLAESDHVPAGIKHQLGTLKQTANPALIFALKGMAIHNLIAFNRAKTVVVDLLTRYFPDQIERAPESKLALAGGGVLRQPKHAPRGKEQLTLLRGGRAETWFVDPEINRMFDDQMPAAALAEVRVLNYVFRNFLHHAFITYNPGFVYATNPVADNLRSYFALPPGVKRRQWIAQQKAAWTVARSQVDQDRVAADMPRRRELRALRKRRQLSPAERQEMEQLDAKALALELMHLRAVATPYDNFAEYAGDQGGMWGRMLRDYSLLPDEASRFALLLERQAPIILKLAKKIERHGLISEVLPKAAAYRGIVRGRKWTREMAAAYVRNQIGTPHIYKRGSRGVVHGTVFPYLNVFLRGMEADTRLMRGKVVGPESRRRKAWEFWRRMAEAVLTPSFLQAAATAGLLGAGLKEIYDAIPEYDRSNYLCVPLGRSAHDEAGAYKAYYLRVRLPETGRLANAMIQHAVNRAANQDPAAASSLQQLGQFGAGQVPGLHPMIGLGAAWASYAAGYQPIDWFRGQPVLSTADWKAGGWEGLRGMLMFTWDELGLSGFSRYDPQSRSLMEFSASATPIVNRLIRVSDGGLREKANKEQELLDRQEAKLRAALPPEVNDLVREYHRLQINRQRTDLEEARYQKLGKWHEKIYLPQMREAREAGPEHWRAIGREIGLASAEFRK